MPDVSGTAWRCRAHLPPTTCGSLPVASHVMPTSQAEGRSGGCIQHPERVPIGRCAKCRNPVCAECHTRIDGILHCRACLAVAVSALETRGTGVLPRLATFVAALAMLAPTLLLSLVMLRGYGFVAGRLARFGAVAFEKTEYVQPSQTSDDGVAADDVAADDVADDVTEGPR